MQAGFERFVMGDLPDCASCGRNQEDLDIRRVLQAMADRLGEKSQGLAIGRGGDFLDFEMAGGYGTRRGWKIGILFFLFLF